MKLENDLGITGLEGFSFLKSNIDKDKENTIRDYVKQLMEYNKFVNLVSRKIDEDTLWQLVKENLLIYQYINNSTVIVDAGSGGGLLGIPVAIIHPGCKVFLVEPRKKKTVFLDSVKEKLELNNIAVVSKRIEEFFSEDLSNLKKQENFTFPTLIARGFPNPGLFVGFLKKGWVKRVVLITSGNKIKKIEKNMVNLKKKTYNIPLRNYLKILKLENVSRET